MTLNVRGETTLLGLVFVLMMLLPAALTADLAKAASQDQKQTNSKIVVPYLPTPQRLVDRMIEFAAVKKGDLVYDLGSGDGRIVIAAAKAGARAVGFELDGKLIKESRANIAKAELQGLAEIREQDLFTVDLSGASVVTMYLFPDVVLKLKPKLLKELKPGARIVIHDNDLGDWKPDHKEWVDGRMFFFWTVPAKAR